MSEAAASVVSIAGLTKSFRTGVTALQEIDLEIRAGEFVSLIGPSGCGKSTLLRIVGDLVQPTSGRVTDAGDRIKPEVKEGQKVLYAKYAGTEFKVEGDDLLIVSQKDILAVVED